MDVVLVHGLAGSSSWWDGVAPALAGRHSVHAVDVPRLPPAALVGHSLGGFLCASVAARRRVPLRAAALIAPTGLPLGRSLPAFGLPLLAAARLAGPRFLPRLAADAVRDGPLSLLLGARHALGADLEADLGAVQESVLLIWGDRDPIVPHRLAERWRRALPRARLVTLEATGHVPMVERSGEVAAALLDFLEEVEREPG